MRRLIVFSLLATLLLGGCSDDEATNPTTDGTLKLSIAGLEDLGATAQYEGWIMVNGSPKSTGTFTVNSSGALSKTEFTLSPADLSAATAFILTVEPKPDPSAAPSDAHILAGDFSGNSASITVGHGAALGNNFASASGKYILATPTDGDGTHEASGIWFLDIVSGNPVNGLNLPTLPTGWIYEGWVVMNGTPVSTGRFTSTIAADNAAPFSGNQPAPPFPGEDFLKNAPSGLSFPISLNSQVTAISIEPIPDNSPNPFGLKPLISTIPAAAADHVVYPLENKVSTMPNGTASR